jgi:hypothetical protein
LKHCAMPNRGPAPHLKACATLPPIPHWQRGATLPRADLPRGKCCATLAVLRPDPAVPPLIPNHGEFGQTPHWKCCAMADAGIAPHRQWSAALSRGMVGRGMLTLGRTTGESAKRHHGPRCAKSNCGMVAHSRCSGMEVKEIEAGT